MVVSFVLFDFACVSSGLGFSEFALGCRQGLQLASKSTTL